MSGLLAMPALGISLILVGIYRYSLIASLLANIPGSFGITLFISMLFLPSLLAFHWRSGLERQRKIGLAALGVVVAFFVLAAATHERMGLAGYAMNALLLGLMEALFIPAFQDWFSEEGKGGLSGGNAVLWGFSCLAIATSPLLFFWTERSASMNAVGGVGMAILALLIVRLSPNKNAAASSSGQTQPTPKAKGMRAPLAVFFLAGAASGAMSNMIYPLALKLLGLKGIWIGLYVCVPLLSAALGALLLKIFGRNAERWFLAFFLGIPLIFLLVPHRMALFLLFFWGLCLGFIETSWLGKQRNFNIALSAKHWGLATGIVVSGLVAQAGINPVGAISAGFYGTLLVGGILWMVF